jgi:hypothetical protein
VIWGRNREADWKVITIQFEQRFFNLNRLRREDPEENGCLIPASVMRMKVDLSGKEELV